MKKVLTATLVLCLVGAAPNGSPVNVQMVSPTRAGARAWCLGRVQRRAQRRDDDG